MIEVYMGHSHSTEEKGIIPGGRRDGGFSAEKESAARAWRQKELQIFTETHLVL